MIPVRRGEEPEELRAERRWRLARAMLLHLDGSRPTDNDLVGYGVAKTALMAAQGNKCAYCEGRERESAPVEHFRPKSTYWWLTWSFGNLFYACSSCNSPSHKGSRFDLFDESTRLAPGERAPGREQPLLLDPAAAGDNPVRFIEFRCIQGKWRPVARRGDRRGQFTIQTFGLDRGPILDHYQDHVSLLRPRIEAVHRAMDDGDGESVRSAWRALIGNSFSKTQAYQGLMYDVLASEFSEETRARWGLTLGEPGSDLPPDPPETEIHNPSHEGLPMRLVLRSCALGDRPEASERDALILALCELRPHTCQDIAAVIERAEPYVRAILKALLTKNLLGVTEGHYHKVQTDVSGSNDDGARDA